MKLGLILIFIILIQISLGLSAEELASEVKRDEASIKESSAQASHTQASGTKDTSNKQDTSPFWLNLKPKVVEYLDKNVNPNNFKYELLGPVVPMKKFLGNLPSVAVTVSGFNPNSKSDIQTLLVKAKNGEFINVQVKVLKYRNILISRRNHVVNELLSIENFTTEKRLIIPRDYDLYADAPLGNVTLNTNLAAGNPLKRNMLVQQQMIRGGENIRVISESAHLRLEFRCQALTSGAVGATITVKCPDINKASVKAKVEDIGLARLL